MIDIHCHLENKYYNNIEEIIEKCKKNNIEKIIVSGYDLESSIEAVELSNTYDNVYATIGYLPEVIYENKIDDIKELEKLVKLGKVVGIGEIGLDYHWYQENKEKQKELFVKQILLAQKYNLPIVIHCREAITDCYEILKEYKPKKCVMHCFSGSLEMAKKFIDLGVYISIGGISTFKNAKKIVEVIKNIPLEYIVLETDSPYLTPEPHRGKINYPYYVSYVADKIANIKGVEKQVVEDITTANSYKLFDF